MTPEQSQMYAADPVCSLQRLFFVKEGKFPNIMACSTTRDAGGREYIEIGKFKDELDSTFGKEEPVEVIRYSSVCLGDDKEEYALSIILPESGIYARVDKSINSTYILYGDSHLDKVDRFYRLIKKHRTVEKIEKDRIHTIGYGQQGYFLISQKVNKVEDFSIGKQYNDDFVDEDRKINDFIGKENRPGLVILHGEKGTGKTTYIRHLINTYEDKQFVMVPSGLVSLLGTPDFGMFLGTLKDSVIIIEDCENAIRSRSAVDGNGSAVSLLLNLTDGLLSDALNIKFICTFNADLNDIDSALLRKGRLMSKYEFKALETEKSNILLKELYGKDTEDSDSDGDIPTTGRPMTLADIYNYDYSSYEKKTKKLGF